MMNYIMETNITKMSGQKINEVLSNNKPADMLEANRIFINPNYANSGKHYSNRNIHINPMFSTVHINPAFRNTNYDSFARNAYVNPNFSKKEVTNKVLINPKHFNSLVLNNNSVKITQNTGTIIKSTSSNASKYSYISSRKLVKKIINPVQSSESVITLTKMPFLMKTKKKLIRLPLQKASSNIIASMIFSKDQYTKKFKCVSNPVFFNKKNTLTNVHLVPSKSRFKISYLQRANNKEQRSWLQDNVYKLYSKKYFLNNLNKASLGRLKKDKKVAVVFGKENSKLKNYQSNKYKQNIKEPYTKNISYAFNLSKINHSERRRTCDSLIQREFLRMTNIPCQVFRKYGICKRNEQRRCFKVHDKKQIDVCKDYLIGKCSKTDCLLSHDTSASKMPICLHFLAGICARDNCIYPHIKHSSDAPVCKDFLRGFCKKAEKCKQRHIFMCSEFAKTNTCLRTKCPFPHSTRKVAKQLKLKNNLNKHNLIELNKSDRENNKTRYYDNTDLNYEVPIEENEKNCDNRGISTNANDDINTNERHKIGNLPSYIPF